MREACFCGRVGEIEDRKPVVVGDGRRALRCPTEGCGHLELLAWMTEEARRFVFAKAERRWTMAAA